MKLRSHLVILVVAALLPVLIFTGVMIVVFGRQQQRHAENGLVNTARALSLAVDRELMAWTHTLETLAISEHLDSGDLKKFYSQAQRVLQARQEWETIVLVDLPKKQILNLRRPFGLPLSDVQNQAQLTRVIETRRPVVSNLFPGQILGKPLVGVAVPVIHAGKLRYVLMSAVSPASLSRLLLQQKLTDKQVATVIDGNKIIIAQNRNIEQLIGKPAGQQFAAKIEESQETVWRGVMRDGQEVYSAMHRSELSGWTVGVAIHATALDAPLRHTLLIVIGGGLALLLAGVAMATVFGRRIANSITALCNAATALGHSETPQTTTSAVVEVNNVARVIEDAAVRRRQAEEERSHLVAIVESSNDAIVGRTLDGIITSWNKAAERIFGYRPEEAIGRLITMLFPAEQMDIVERNSETIRQGKIIESYEGVRIRKDGRPIHISATVSPVKDENGNTVGVASIARDITERKRTEIQTRLYIQRLTILQEITQSVTSTLDPDIVLDNLLEKIDLILPSCVSNIRLINRFTGELIPAACRNFDEKEKEKWLAQSLFGFSQMVRDTKSPLVVTDLREDPRVSKPSLAREYGLISHLGLPLIAEDNILGVLGLSTRYEHRFADEEVEFFMGLASQAAIAIQNAQLHEEVLDGQQRLIQLTRKLLTIQENERRHIAREVHDEIGQTLTALKLSLEMVERFPANRARAMLHDSRELVTDMMAQVRSLLHDLRPPMLDQLGLLPTLEWHFKRYTAQTHVRVHFSHKGSLPRFGPALETAVYRIVQEGLNNIARHAGVKDAEVSLCYDGKTVDLQIQDHGKGFKPNAALSYTNSNGLSGIVERAAMLDGRCTIQSSLEGGTCLKIKLPAKMEQASV
jgi:PAS domain S-box-containing protein